MRRLVLLLFLLSACPAATNPRAAMTDPNALSSVWLSVPVQACIPKNGQAVSSNHYADWINNGPTAKVTAACIWIGAASPGSSNLGGVLDIPVMLWDINSGGIFDWFSEDRYDTSYDPPHCQSWAPYYFPVNTGDDVRFTVGCAGPYNGNQPVSVQGLAVIQTLMGQ